MKHILLFVILPILGIAQVDTIQLQDSAYIRLSDRVKENSGLLYHNGTIFTFNDSGGTTELFGFSPQDSTITQTLLLKNAKNIDWEDIAMGDDEVFVADIGNNLGSRKDFEIYRFPLKKLKDDKKDSKTTVRNLRFLLDDQYDYAPKEPRTTNFDMEALIYDNKKLHIFTKEWSSGKTTHYTLEPYYIFQYALNVESIRLDIMVTAADVKENELVLVGYSKEGLVYMYQFYDYSDGKYFNGKYTKTFLGFSPSIGQIEGVCYGPNGIYISGEALDFMGFQSDQKMYFIPQR